MKKIQARVIIEILGKPKEHVESTIKKYVDEIEKNEQYQLLEKYYSDIKEIENMWGIFAELELATDEITNLIEFCFDYMPSSVEIIKPEKQEITDKQLSDLLNDLQAKLHRTDMIIKQSTNESLHLKQNFRVLLKNFVTIMLHNAEKTAENLGVLTGVKKEEMEKLLESLVEEGLLIKKNDRYTLTKNDK